MVTIAQAFPLFQLKIISEDVLLRLPRDEEIISLAAKAYDNILSHKAEHFLSGPTGKWSSPEEAQISMLRFHWLCRALLNPDDWRLVFFIYPLGSSEPVGCMDLNSKDFHKTRTVKTGSWILKDFQGQGLGLASRRAAVQFAFDDLGANFAVSYNSPDNEASNHISEKLGYQRGVVEQRGGREQQSWLLNREDFTDFADLAVIGLKQSWPSLGVEKGLLTAD